MLAVGNDRIHSTADILSDTIAINITPYNTPKLHYITSRLTSHTPQAWHQNQRN